MARPGSIRRWAEAFAVAGSLGLEFALASFAGGAVGFWLDRVLNWPPIGFTILFGLAGAAAGFYLMLRTLRTLERRDRDKP